MSRVDLDAGRDAFGSSAAPSKANSVALAVDVQPGEQRHVALRSRREHAATNGSLVTHGEWFAKAGDQGMEIVGSTSCWCRFGDTAGPAAWTLKP